MKWFWGALSWIIGKLFDKNTGPSPEAVQAANDAQDRATANTAQSTAAADTRIAQAEVDAPTTQAGVVKNLDSGAF